MLSSCNYNLTAIALHLSEMSQLPSGVGVTTPEEARRGCVVLTPNGTTEGLPS